MIRKFSLLSVLTFVMLVRFSNGAGAEEIVVSAAASLTDALQEIGSYFKKANPGITVRFNFGASGALQQQIQQGAPVDVFASAGVKEMDILAKARQVETKSRINFAGNRLVLIIPLGGTIKRWEDLKLPFVHRVALSNPASVPSGRYAQDVLTHRNLWNAVKDKAIFGENVRQTLTYVSAGDVDAGLVFLTDALQAGNRVRVIQIAIVGVDHVLIVYPAAVVAGTGHAAAAHRFVTFLKGRLAQVALKKFGFAMPNVTVSGTKH